MFSGVISESRDFKRTLMKSSVGILRRKTSPRKSAKSGKRLRAHWTVTVTVLTDHGRDAIIRRARVMARSGVLE